MEYLKGGALKAAFEQKQQEIKNKITPQVCQLVAEISDMFAELHALNINVSLDLFATASETTFRLFDKDHSQIISPVSGILTIENMQYHFGISILHKSEPCLKMAVSQFDLRHEGTHAYITGNTIYSNVLANIYDCNQPDGLKKFQIFIIEKAARQQELDKHDRSNALKGKTATFFKKDFTR